MIKNEEILKRFNSDKGMKEQMEEPNEIQIGTIFLDAIQDEDGSRLYSRLVSVEDRLFLIACDKDGELYEDMEHFDVNDNISLNEMSIYSFNREIEDLIIWR